ncbi:RNase H-like domain found in reverse transcriptase [Popillia japonica]|uniref:RNase H-like domain found in reverse transcriptase n=1 Tax=Popillia japonica TaxID=7064 RepID=A0AAW1K3U2_POPJA
MTVTEEDVRKYENLQDLNMTIKILYKIIFEDDSDRRGRKKIREFTGFKYDKNADEYKNKSAFVNQSFSFAELVAICNLLHLDYEGALEDLAEKIMGALINVDSLRKENKKDYDEEDEYDDSEGRIEPSDAKTKAVLRFPELKTIKQVQSFLGLTGYFRKFIPQYSVIARPLTDLLQKNQMFKFQEKEKIAFETLKSLLADKPVLQIYRQGADTEVHTDASQEGYGAVLMQKSRPGLKLRAHYLGPYQVTKVKPYNSYDVVKEGDHYGPTKSTTTAEYMKRWTVSNTGSSGGEEEEPKDRDSDVDKVSGSVTTRTAECRDDI